jgi:hypothetical protein
MTVYLNEKMRDNDDVPIFERLTRELTYSKKKKRKAQAQKKSGKP